MADACHSPSFLKKITELPMRTLPLPSSFVKTHGKLLRSDVILEGPSRKQWKVVVDGSSPSLNVTFGKGWEEFVIAHVLQLGDQLCFTLTANSHFQVEVYDESGCQKTSALDATGSNASAPSFSRRLSESQIPPPVSDSNSAATRVSQIQNLDDSTLKNENLDMHNNGAGERTLSDIQLESAVASALRLRRESALESNRRDLTRRGSALRDPNVLPPMDGSSALLTNDNNPKAWAPSFPRGSSALQTPKSDTTATRRQSQIKNLDDPTLKVENFSMSTKEAGEKPHSHFQLGSSPLLLRRESALECIRRDSSRKGSAVRDPYVLLPTYGGSAILPNSNPRGLVPDSLLDLADCFVDIEKILSERPDLTDTEPLVIEDIPPCWELHEHTPAATSTSLETTKRVSTLFSSRPPDLRIPSVSKIENHDTTARSLAPQQSEQRTPKRVLLRPAALQIPPVLESESQTPTSTKTPMRLSQIQNLDDPSLKAENLALYTKVAAEKALSELQLESATGSPLTGSPLSRRESSIFKAQSSSI